MLRRRDGRGRSGGAHLDYVVGGGYMTFDEWRETLKAYYSYRGSAPHIKGVDFHAEWTRADGTLVMEKEGA